MFGALRKFKPLTYVWALVILVLIGVIVYGLPPEKITIEAGPKGGFFDTTALMLKERLKERHIDVTVINSEQTSKIIDRVNDVTTSIDLGFIAHEVKPGQFPKVKSLGSIIMDPLFIFQRTGLDVQSVADLKGMRLGVGPAATGGRIITDIILKEYGINPENTTYEVLSFGAMVSALKAGTIDVGFFLQPTSNKVIEELGSSGRFNLVSLEYAAALIKKNGSLHHVKIDRGAFKLIPESPNKDIHLVGIPVTVVAKADLHPAVSMLVSVALKQAFGGPTLVSTRGNFPSMSFERDLTIDPTADEIYRNGIGYAPLLYRVFNFSVAGTIDRMTFALSMSGLLYILLFVYLGVPKPFDMWKNGTAARRMRALEKLKEKSNRRPLTTRELKQFQTLEEFFTASLKSSEKASRLINEVKSNKQSQGG